MAKKTTSPYPPHSQPVRLRKDAAVSYFKFGWELQWYNISSLCAIDEGMHLRIDFRGSRIFQARSVHDLCVLLASSFDIRVGTLVHLPCRLLVTTNIALGGDTLLFAYVCGSPCNIRLVVLLENVDSVDCAWFLRRMGRDGRDDLRLWASIVLKPNHHSL